MPYGFYISAEGANAQSSRLDVIANNLANVDTVGFKRELACFQARYAEGIDKGTAIPGSGNMEDVGGGVSFRQTKTDFSAGAVKQTKNPANVAIMGEGFFTVKKGEETFLTRAGNFEINSRGELVTPQGYSVLDESGVPVVINPEVKHWDISDTGAMRQPGNIQNLAIVKPAANENLVKYGDNLYRSTTRPEPVQPAERRVASGCLEMSAVSPTLEMTAMIEASRYFEANVNMMKTQDQILSSLISRVLKA
ncbi:MAG: flagellar basal-body rod protein FlgF [Thermoguttaceae bacterium]|jgi:flagellar basal-body rod protein FlgF